MRPKLFAVFAVTLLLLAGLAPAVAAEGDLSVAANQAADGETTVTVTHDGTALENASVTVDAPNATYDGEGGYDTDSSGTVSLPAPDDDVTVVVTASDGNHSASTTVELEAPTLDVAVAQGEDGSATATVTYSITDAPVDGADVNVTTVDGNDTYDGTGDYTTDENGTVDLPEPDETVEIQVDAASGDLSGSTTAELENVTEAEESDSFGQQVSAFVHSLLNGTEEQRRIGRLIADWVTSNNPGNAPDHAGPPDDAGPPASVGGNETDGNATASGPPENPGNGNAGNGGGNGPPDDPGNGNGKAKGNGK